MQRLKICVKSKDGFELSTICRQLKMKALLRKEGSESVTKCNRLKMEAADGNKYLTDAADSETLLRLISPGKPGYVRNGNSNNERPGTNWLFESNLRELYYGK